ncbi:hypothetical protein Palpr_1025 [Paludibacter propionicigenes WB4]|uniref:Uncharacterized protein n=1 Tax=Paludibacter propionicigenes (strain DSM 17365 / JCM 13257 / WB4) TaxID=694427 RepID=E4T380_PALPW|nr:hypothetical protein [Paludibacter propionicigenes]ADQ79174.1 hypothetical protein Palpr_1025 [Paludibacter propionicigenes WB4]
MEWYHYLNGFFVGAFLSNSLPHLVKGVCGDKFPTPFAKPSGRGLSSPALNVVWALLNMVIAYLFFRFSKLSFQDNLSVITFFAGFAIVSLISSKGFASKHKE